MAKTSRAKKVYNPKNFMGRGVNSPESGLTPKESVGMGTFYGRAMKNPMGKVRDATVGFRPVNEKQLGTPPKSLA